jgi:hypothetical protein
MGINEESVNVEETVTETNEVVSDAELDAAFAEFMGEDEIEAENELPVTEEKPIVPDVEHSEASRLGRKVKRMELNMVSKEEVSSINAKLDKLFEKLSPVVTEPKYDEYGNVITEPVDIKELAREAVREEIRQEKEQEKAKNKEYEDQYVETLRELMDEIDDPVIKREVFKKMTTPGSDFNVKYSDNPLKDVAKNFYRAVKNTSSNKPFTGERGAHVATGVTNANTNTTVARKPRKLDPEAEELAKASGLSQEEIDAALDGDLPNSLIGRTRA